jgi:ABC-type Fe3+-siderophore transport system permease subunit
VTGEIEFVFGEHRDKRLQRRQEADDFRRIFQPLSLFFGVMGLLLLAWVGLNWLEGQPVRREIVGAALTIVSFPVLVFIFRLARGHFRKDLHR